MTGEQIDERKAIARRLGVSPNALRIRAHRIKESLGDCINNCLMLKDRKIARTAPKPERSSEDEF
jgi:hypothetical protein